MSAEKFLNMLRENTPLAYDVETNGLDTIKGFVCGYSLSDGKHAYYVPVRHGGGGNIDNPEAFEAEMAKVIKARTKPLYTHNGKFDSHFSLSHGIELGSNLEDTMISSALLDDNARSYSLKAQAARHKDIPQKQDTPLYHHLAEKFNVAAKGSSMSEFWRLAGDDPMANEYAAGDTLTTFHLHEKHKQEIYGQNLDFLYNIENRLIHVLRKMERRGMKIDMEEVGRATDKVSALQLEAYSKIPMKDDFEPMNIRSNKDLQEYFTMHEFTDWEYTSPTERNPHGLPSFNKGFLGQSDAGKILLEARALDVLKNTFIDPIQTFIKDGHVHCDFNQTQSEFGGTKSGRFSCRNPNLQQVPKRDEHLGSIFRKVFVATKGYTFVELDYSQCEPRLFAHYANEKVLIQGYTSDPPIDMHGVAAKLMRIERKVAKNLNLGLFYTMGIAKLAKHLGVSEDTARTMYYSWKRSFPELAAFTKLATQVAESRGYVKTILGRRARFPDPRWAYRAANRIVQGGSADIIKYKMLEIDDYLVANNLEDKVRMLLTIHDAILLEVEDSVVIPMTAKIKEIMENVQVAPFNLKVPFVADYTSGKDWAEASYAKH